MGEKCDSGKDQTMVVHEAVQSALEHKGEGQNVECNAIKCVVECAQSLGCLTSEVKSKCLNVKRDSTCDISCDGSSSAHRIAGGANSDGLVLFTAVLGALSISVGW